ncbi:MAG TPA: hypothetical protein PLK76_02100 [bacterium]|mgnify:CR=1 FL=1|nr:hypothetical protein [bacterium]
MKLTIKIETPQTFVPIVITFEKESQLHAVRAFAEKNGWRYADLSVLTINLIVHVPSGRFQEFQEWLFDCADIKLEPHFISER